MGIKLDDLNSLGAELFNDSESLMGNIRSLSEDELNISGGGSYGFSGSGFTGQTGFTGTGFPAVINIINGGFAQPAFQPIAQPVFQPIAQPVFQQPVAQPNFGGTFFAGYGSS